MSAHACSTLYSNNQEWEATALNNSHLEGARELNEAVHNLLPVLQREFDLS